ncbi:response regulator transcription factor [Stenotrophomonas maltophilia]|uniref:LuxR C-terminal-related transcriptional regulator n=1 Tax=Stenotrophomonas geniculata TaxID=86188 RepID=UPI001D083B69|nr:response regulator transcription factor [Stenotrophomonas geniculata]MCB7145207.1 response regulator transcription factor [Stenotrophomonas maltophilia]MCI1102398.1 response regulator transcription factor [Stenotrophomonas maltophilia]
MDLVHRPLGIIAKIQQIRCSTRQQRQNDRHALRAPITSQRMNGYPAPRRLRLALLDDHEVVRRGTVLHLSRDIRFDIVASHTRSDELVGSLRRLAVDVAIIDLTLAPGDRSSDELVSLLRECFPHVPLLAFATLTPTTRIDHLLTAGISGVVSKSEPLEMLSEAIVRISQGLCRLPADCLFPANREELSRNEREVLDLLLAGLTVSEIALHRHRSVKTVSTQKVAALRKLGLRNDVEIYALRRQLGVR